MLGLQRLEERRMRSDLIETFKIVNRKYDINPELFFQLDEGYRRGHDQKLFKKRFRLNVRKYVFSNSVVDNWNLLPASCIKCSTINTFKKHLSSELESEVVKFKVCQLSFIMLYNSCHLRYICHGMLYADDTFSASGNIISSYEPNTIPQKYTAHL